MLMYSIYFYFHKAKIAAEPLKEIRILSGWLPNKMDISVLG